MTSLGQKYTDIVKQAIKKAEREESNIDEDVLNIHGLSSNMVRHFLNNLCSFDDCRYLEIGSFKGSTICSAINNNEIKATCIDNFSEFKSKSNRRILLNNINLHKKSSEVLFIEADCFSIDTSDLPKFNVFFYDGNHEEESQYRAFEHFNDCLDDIFIAVIDDYSWDFVREGTERAFRDLNYEIVYKEIKETLSAYGTSTDAEWREGLTKGFWNGIYVGVIKKNGCSS